MQNDKFTQKLWEKYSIISTKNGWVQKPEVYANLLKRIFADVSTFSTKDYNYNVVEDTFGEFKTLGEFFANAKGHGIYDAHPALITTDYKVSINNGEDDCRLAIRFYDDKFEMYQVDEYLDYDKWVKIDYLNQRRFQERYIGAMYELFGEEYKEHYKNLLKDITQ